MTGSSLQPLYGFNSFYLVTNVDRHLFMNIYIEIFSLIVHLFIFHSLLWFGLIFKIILFVFSMLNFENLWILDISPLLNSWFVNIFCLSLCFHLNFFFDFSKQGSPV